MTDRFQKFDEWSPRKATLTLIEDALEAYEVMRMYKPTLRTLFYQLVSEDKVENTFRAYKNLGNTLTKARDAGLFPWNALLDNNRTFHPGYSSNDTIESVLQDQYIWLNYWEGQENYVEIWVEKDAQAGTVEVAAEPYRCPWMACKGYLSATMAFDAGKRFAYQEMLGKTCHLIHLGDHDPSGFDMTRDNGDRIEKYARERGCDLNVHRIALNYDQVEEYNPPPNDAKLTDPRAQGYIDQYGPVSWELDALKPKILVPIITTKLESLIDMDVMNQRKEDEENAGEELDWITNNTDEVIEFVRLRMSDEE